MSEIVFNLKNRAITDNGEVLLKYPALLTMARDCIDFHHYKCLPDYRITTYNKVAEMELIQFEPDGTVTGPSEGSYEWNTPKSWKSVNLAEWCSKELYERDLTDEPYITRLSMELEAIEKRNMGDMVRHLMYLVDVWKKREAVWGVGRGSSCASLVMFLIGLNKIDPVKYDIPMNEFFR